MMVQENRDKVIRGLKNLTSPAFTNDLPCNQQLFRDAVTLLEAQEPVEPLRINHDTKWQKDNDYLCGECGGSFYRLKMNFCPWCGRQVKWE